MSASVQITVARARIVRSSRSRISRSGFELKLEIV
jgi:hypothetical protein